MKILDFEPANCKNCYKCVRNCTVKAIKMINDQAQIIEDRCIACGKCFLVCPQNARYILSDLDKVIKAINSEKKVIISLAPSYIGIFKEPYKLVGALRKIGIDIIEETSIGASIITELYKQHIENASGKLLISSACPSVNLMIQQYYPELLDNLIPVDSPMIAHCKILKKKYGDDTFISFLGPCIAKKYEANPYQKANLIDAVISFEELEKYLNEKNINISDCIESMPDKTGNNIGQNYPIESGILSGLTDLLNEKNYISTPISGTKNCKDFFESITINKIHHVFIEANSCEGGCIDGPAIPKNSENVYIRNINFKNHFSNNLVSDNKIRNNMLLNYDRRLPNRKIIKNKYTEEQIKSILSKIGKHTKDDELNCGSCGYDTCREKAISVLDGLSYPEMCLPYMKNKAERISNISFEYSPNILFIVDNNLNILDLNPKAECAFNIKLNNFKDKSISLLIPTEDCEKVIISGKSILNKKLYIENYGLTVYSSFIYLSNLKIVFILLLDITDSEIKKERLLDLKLKTIETADKVIEKQMRVAQEIAGLLGETTAETKTTLLKLKHIVANEESDIKPY